MSTTHGLVSLHVASAILYSLLILGVSSRTKRLRSLVFALNTCIILWIVGNAGGYKTNGIATDYTTGSALFTIIFLMSDFLLLTDPMKEFRMRASLVDPEKLAFFERAWWSLQLVASPRMIGWSVEPSDILPKQPYSWARNQSRFRFVIRQCAILALEALFICIAPKWIPMLDVEGPHLADLPWLSRSIYTVLLGVFVILIIDGSHQMWMITLVGIGGRKPSDFRPLYGSFSHAYTLQGLWGRTWHQMHRRKFTAHARFVTSRLGIPRTSSMSLIASLYVAFFISGAVHYAGDCLALRHWRGGSMKFFLLQAIGVHVEKMAIETKKRLMGEVMGSKERQFWKVVGYICVWQWFAWSAPIMFDPLLEAWRIS